MNNQCFFGEHRHGLNAVFESEDAIKEYPYMGVPITDRAVLLLEDGNYHWGRKLLTKPTTAQMKDVLFWAKEIGGRWYLVKGLAHFG